MRPCPSAGQAKAESSRSLAVVQLDQELALRGRIQDLGFRCIEQNLPGDIACLRSYMCMIVRRANEDDEKCRTVL